MPRAVAEPRILAVRLEHEDAGDSAKPIEEGNARRRAEGHGGNVRNACAAYRTTPASGLEALA